MRISQSLISNIVRHGADRAARALMKAQQPLQDGTSLPRPSVDLPRADRASVLDQFDRELERFESARGLVRHDLSSTEQALAGIHDVVVQAQDLAIEMGTDSIDVQTRKDAAAVARRLLEELATLANRRDAGRLDGGGKFFLTGLAENQPPLAADYHYQGNDGVRLVEVSPGVTIASTMSGRDVFGPNNELVTSLEELATALDAGDASAVRATLDGLSAGRERVSGAWMDAGSRIAMLDDLGELTLSLRTNVQIELGTLKDVDLAQVAPAIQNAQTMLEAVVTTSQRIIAQVGTSWFQ